MRRTFKPTVEVLSDRITPRCTVRSVGSTVIVTGDDNANSVLILDNGTGVGSDITLRCDGVTYTPPGIITNVRVKLKGGDDLAEYQLNNRNLRPALQRTINVLGGTGSDLFTGTLRGEVQAGSRLAINYHGGAGDDQFTSSLQETVRAGALLSFGLFGDAGNDSIDMLFPDAPVNSTGQLFIDVNGGAGKDTLIVEYSGACEGQGIATVQGGGGKDRVSVNLNLTNAGAKSNGNMAGSVFGGADNDNLKLTIHRIDPTAPVKFSGLVDGGRGRDTCEVSPGILDISCERRRSVP